MDRRTALWGLEWAPRTQEPLWVVEGVFDALPLFPYGVATFGKSVTPEQVELLASLRRPLVVCLDGDAWTECMALAARLGMRRQAAGRDNDVTWAKLPPASDPGSLGWSVKNYVAAQ
jgi:DNA primase